MWRNLKNDAVTWGKNIIQGMADGITDRLYAARDAVSNVAESVKNKVKNAFGIHSPSTVMNEYGQNISQGLADGITTKSGEVIGAMGNIVTGVQGQIDAITSSFTTMKQTLETPIVIPAPVQSPPYTAPSAEETPNIASVTATSIIPTDDVYAPYSQDELSGNFPGIKEIITAFPQYHIGLNQIQQAYNKRVDKGIAEGWPSFDIWIYDEYRNKIGNVRYGQQGDTYVFDSISKYGAGGVVYEPTLGIIGDKPEVVMPLPTIKPMLTDALLGAVTALGGGNITNNKQQINLQIINRGTVVGRGGMEEFAKTVSKQISRDFGLATGGAW